MGKTQQFITIKEAAEYLGVTANTVRNWGAAGKIPEYRHPVNNYRLYKLEEIETLRDQGTTQVRAGYVRQDVDQPS